MLGLPFFPILGISDFWTSAARPGGSLSSFKPPYGPKNQAVFRVLTEKYKQNLFFS